MSWLTNWVDSGPGMAITLVAFLIILVVMFKNVLVAAYCAYPKLWDRADVAHKEAESIGWVQQFRDAFMTKDIDSGSFSNAIMRILSNIKTLTDFEGDTARPKTCFTRAIPQMLLCVIIGAFVYNRYYRDTAAEVVDFGSEMVSCVLLEVDPIAAFGQFTGSAGRPVFASDDSELPQQKLVNRITTKVYGAIIGEYNDIENINDRRAIANTIEDSANSWVAEPEGIDPSYTDGESWKSILQVSLVNDAVSIDHISGASVDNGSTMQYTNQFAVPTLNLPSTINVGENMYVCIRLDSEKNAVSDGKYIVTDLVWHVGFNGSVQVFVGSNLNTKNITAPYIATQGSDSMKIAIQYVSGSGNKIQEIVFSDVSGSKNGVWEISGGTIVHDSKGNRDRKITSISFDGNNTLSSANENRDGIIWEIEDLGIASLEAPAPSTPLSDEGAKVE